MTVDERESGTRGTAAKGKGTWERNRKLIITNYDLFSSA